MAILPLSPLPTLPAACRIILYSAARTLGKLWTAIALSSAGQESPPCDVLMLFEGERGEWSH